MDEAWVMVILGGKLCVLSAALALILLCTAAVMRWWMFAMLVMLTVALWALGLSMMLGFNLWHAGSWLLESWGRLGWFGATPILLILAIIVRIVWTSDGCHDDS